MLDVLDRIMGGFGPDMDDDYDDGEGEDEFW
jgi:hypothetical protein